MRPAPCLRSWIAPVILTFSVVPRLFAEQLDAPPVDASYILQTLKTIKEDQPKRLRDRSQAAASRIQAAVASPDAAASFWEEAVKAVQFDGVHAEASKFREWKDKDGDALDEKEIKQAAQLHLNWLTLTFRRAMGVSVHDLMPQILEHVGALTTFDAQIDKLLESLKAQKEMAESKTHGERRRTTSEEAVRRVYNQIKAPVNEALPAQALQITDLLQAEKWEMSWSDLGKILDRIVMPEMRATKDPRILEMWEMKMQDESQDLSRKKTTFEADKFKLVHLPNMLWDKAQDLYLLGQKNRAIGDMVNLVKTYPNHPNSANWIAKLEQLLAPQQPAPAPAPAGGPANNGNAVPPRPATGGSH